MSAFMLYIVQSTVCLSLFYGLYRLLLRNETIFGFNRAVLLAVMAFSMIIPLIRIPVAEPTLVQLPVMRLQEAFIIEKLESPEISTASDSEIPITTAPVPKNTVHILPFIYFTGLLAGFLAALISIGSVIRIITTARPVMFGNQRIWVSPRKIGSFSFAGRIVLSETDYERFATEIVAHEMIHKQKGHFWDLCFAGSIAVLHWFNPVAWLLKREMRNLHEYEADHGILSQGIDATRYKLLLIEKAAGASRYSVADSFAQSKIKKRIIMMNKQKPNPWARWKALLFIPPAALLLQAFARPEINREIEQISNVKTMEIFQESSEWTEEKFLEEFRKFMPDGVTRELINPVSWEKAAKKYQFFTQTGIVIGMNKHGKMLVNNKFINLEDIPVLMAKNLAGKGEEAAPVIIDGKEIDKIIRYTLIERDMNVPKDAYQNLLNAVSEAYISKRNEMAEQYYHTGYGVLDAEKKAVMDHMVPILVMTEVKGDFSKTHASKEEFENHTIIFNGQPIKFKDIDKAFPDQLKNELVYIISASRSNNKRVSYAIAPVEGSSFVLNKKWGSTSTVDVMKIVSIDTYSPEEAVKRYGNKAKNGAISIECVSGTPPPPPPIKK